MFEKPTHPFFCAWSFLLVHIWFTSSEKPNITWFKLITMFVGLALFCVYWKFKKSDHESWTTEEGHLPWSDFMVHGVNRPTSVSCVKWPYVEAHLICLQNFEVQVALGIRLLESSKPSMCLYFTSKIVTTNSTHFARGRNLKERQSNFRAHDVN
jgi:hypothetical protein